MPILASIFGMLAISVVWHLRHNFASMATITQRFGERVKKLRSQKKMSQLDLALKAKLDLTTVNEIENGNREPILRTIWKISNALGIDLQDLFKF